MRQDIDQDEWIELLENDENAVILDVRTDGEIEEGYIANMKQIDFLEGQNFLEEVAKLDKSKNYYIYCRSGNRSGQACDIMEQLGFDTTYNLEGGFMNWTGDIVED
ncbi:rhodanese-like domain-containing protein [Aquimarina agarivorans]|uniref:rhodanese-like domain-containing protein n=1 Tax=Aquimarina agarivorans TaxID=980584 RepID=UPI000248E735|nr:rhodanese-like domain-containing protein [Aquimarina agarivorans]